MGEDELDRMCDEANRDWLRACVVADAVVLPTGVRSMAYANADSSRDSHATRPDAPGAWPEPYDPAGDSDSDSGSLNAGLDRLGNHHQSPGGFGRVDRAQSMDRQRRDVPPDGREPVRDQDREAVMERPEQAGPPLSSIPGLIEQIRLERDAWKSRAEAAERKLTDRAQCCTENEGLLREIALSAVEFEGPRVGYVAVQIDRETWLAVQKYREEKP